MPSLQVCVILLNDDDDDDDDASFPLTSSLPSHPLEEETFLVPSFLVFTRFPAALDPYHTYILHFNPIPNQSSTHPQAPPPRQPQVPSRHSACGRRARAAFGSRCRLELDHSGPWGDWCRSR